MRWFRIYIALIICCYNVFFAHSQFTGLNETPDSLLTKSYNELYTYFYESYLNDVNNSEILATAFIKKAYIERDTLQLANGYYMITYNNDDEYIVFNDSLLKYAKYLKGDEINYYSWYAYQGKGSYYFDKRDFKKSFDNHLEALKIAEILNDLEFLNISTTNLGLLEERTGRNQEALAYFKKNYIYELEKNKDLKNSDSLAVKSFLNSICLLSNSYRLNKEYDSAQKLNSMIFKYKKLLGSSRYLGIARINEAEVNFELENYKTVVDTVEKAIPILIKHKNVANLAIAYHLRGLSRIRLNLVKKGVEDLNRMDSIFNIKQDLHPSLRTGYSFLRKYYKEKGNLQKQLYFVNQLLKFDSLKYNYSQHISKGIYTKNRDKLISTQKKLQTEVQKTNKTKSVITYASISMITLLLFEILRRKRKNEKVLKDYQLRFDKLLELGELKEVSGKNQIKRKPHEISIPYLIIKGITKKIEEFESEFGFLDRNISAIKLAQEFGTNQNYLGQIIKLEHNMTFRQYINNLRIEFVLKKLRDNNKLVNYSIQAIARESGFNNAEPFSKAFKAKTGFYPSDFIQQIKNEQVA